MITTKQLVRKILPVSTWDFVRNTYRLRLQDKDWYRTNEGKVSTQRIRALKNKHQGQRCFIIGNGPSLRNMDLSLLKNEYTFGLNRIYLLFAQLGFTTTYLVSTNQLVIEQSAEELRNISVPKFLSWRCRHVVEVDEYTTFIRPMGNYEHVTFSHHPEYGINEGATVTYVAMQLAYYMGFKKVILIGVDHNFVTQGAPHKAIVSEGPDPNHFSGAYFGKGFRWQLPDLDTSEKAYRLARTIYANDHREIVDATVNGKLQVFPKVSFNSLF